MRAIARRTWRALFATPLARTLHPPLRSCAAAFARARRSAPLRLALLLAFYIAFLWLGLDLYERGLVFSFGGTTFGAQLLCVALSAACLLLSSAIGSRVDVERIVGGCHARRWAAQANDGDGNRAAAELEEGVYARLHSPAAAAVVTDECDAESSPALVTQRLLRVAPASSPPTDASSSSAGGSSAARSPTRAPPLPRALRWASLAGHALLSSAPLLLPVVWSVHILDTPREHGTNLSAQINVMLFSAIAGAMFLAAGLVYLVFVRRKGRIVARVTLPPVALVLLYLLANYLNALDSYAEGLHTPALMLRREVQTLRREVLRQSDVSAAELQLESSLKELFASSPSLRPRSLLDSPRAVAERLVAQSCPIPPTVHLASILPRRSANFFTGSETCPPVERFSEVEWKSDAAGAPVEPHLLLTCLSSRTFFATPSPDYIRGRSMRQTSVWRHYHEWVIGDLVRRNRSAEASLRTQLHALSTPSARRDVTKRQPISFPMGSHGFWSLQCGAEENVHLTFLENANVTARATQIMREQLFKEEYDAAEKQSQRQEEATTASEHQQQTSAVPPFSSPLLSHPPILLLYIDCVSRAHFLRSMPLTAAFLRELHNSNDATRSRTVRERFYEVQQRKQRAQRQLKRTNADQWMAQVEKTQRVQQLREQLRALDSELDVALDTAATELQSLHFPSPPSSAAPRSFSVTEHYGYHVVEGFTRGNLQAMLCASGHSGWGGSLTPEALGGRVRYAGRGQPRPPWPLWGSSRLGCDSRDLVWNRLKRSGYVTALALNDCTDTVGDLFGIHVDRASSADYELMAPFCHPEYDGRGEWSNFLGPFSMRRRCIAGEHVHDLSIGWARQFIRTHDAREVPWFMFLSFVEAHEGSLAVLRQIDASVASFLRWLLHSTRTPPLLLVASDHGAHLGPFFEFTTAGRVEHKLPTLFTVMPEHWMATRDVLLKRAERDAARKQSKKTVAEQTPLTSSSSSSPYFTLTPSPLSPSSPSLSSVPHSSRRSLATSLGLSLHENQHALVTAREVYWFVRTMPQRVVNDEAARDEQKIESAFRAQQQEAMAKHKSQAGASAGSGEQHDDEEEDADSAPPLSLATRLWPDRTCFHAGIPLHLCVCQPDEVAPHSTSSNSKVVGAAAAEAAAAISKLAPRPQTQPN